ncbi:MAG TPA: hypothetical protein VJ596_02855 [Gemmatimonadaceae bacterium]|nr:hypothetical protein [Gemmatimonadaceae bacterium]
MSRILSGACLALLALALVPRSAFAQRDSAPNLSALMSERERQETGVSSLNAAQRAELEAWLARYTATVTSVARAGRGMPQRIESDTGAATDLPPVRRVDGPRRIMRAPRTLPDAARVLRLMDGGDFVMLDDGTMWEVYLPDRPTTVNWASGDGVRVRQRPAPIGEYDYDLIYGPRRERVAVRFAGWVEMQRDRRRQ